MKRLLAFLLAALLLLTLAGCSQTGKELAEVGIELAAELLETESENEADAPQSETPDEADLPKQEPEEAAAVAQEESMKEEASSTDAEAVESIEEEPTDQPEEESVPSAESEEDVPDEDGFYNSKEDVALYIRTYGHLPGNYITKKDAQALGWQGGSLEPYAPGKSIGGSRFGNYEGLLPEKKGRKYTECDIDTLHASSRGAKRIVFSNDGLIYYTGDHYESFELLYGEE